jgi:hypothetical protein
VAVENAPDAVETIDRDYTPSARCAVAHFPREVSVFRLEGLSFGDSWDDKVDLTERKRLDQVVTGARAGLDRRVERGLAGGDDDDHGTVGGAGRLENTKSIHTRELQVADNQGIPGRALSISWTARRPSPGVAVTGWPCSRSIRPGGP